MISASGLLAFSGPPGRPPQRDSGWDLERELFTDIGQLTDKASGPHLVTPPPRPLREMCAEAGFTRVEQRTAHASFPIRGPQHYGDWRMSHGFRGITLNDIVSFTRTRKP